MQTEDSGGRETFPIHKFLCFLGEGEGEGESENSGISSSYKVTSPNGLGLYYLYSLTKAPFSNITWRLGL